MNEELNIHNSAEAVRLRMPIIYNVKLRFVIISGVVCMCAGLVALGAVIKLPGGLFGISLPAIGQLSKASVAGTALSSADVLPPNVSVALPNARPSAMVTGGRAAIVLMPPSRIRNGGSRVDAIIASKTLAAKVTNEPAVGNVTSNPNKTSVPDIKFRRFAAKRSPRTKRTSPTVSVGSFLASNVSSISTATNSRQSTSSSTTRSTTKSWSVSGVLKATPSTVHLVAADLGKDSSQRPAKADMGPPNIKAVPDSTDSTGGLRSAAPPSKTKKLPKGSTVVFSPPRKRVVRNTNETTASSAVDADEYYTILEDDETASS